jgi:2C-methyl-D-erythritol 2,4-cyclodiphosphate synthase
MRDRLAKALGIAVDAVNVKATRGEGMGFVGREEGAAALAIATLTLLRSNEQDPKIGA